MAHLMSHAQYTWSSIYMKNHTHKEIIPILYNATQIMQLLLQSAFHSKEKKYLEILYYS